jgi:hypothetical protein
MNERKETPMSCRASARFETAFTSAAAFQKRGHAKLLDTFVFEFSHRKCIDVPTEPTRQQN